MKKVYLDNAATTCMHNEVIDAMHQFMTNAYGNPSSSHGFGREAKAEIELTRKTIATELGVTSSEIVFTSGGTESNNLIIRSAIENLGITQIITSPIEHKCVLETCLATSKQANIPLVFVSLLSNGQINLQDLKDKLKAHKGKSFVSLMHANNEVGNLTNIRKVATICESYNAVFHSDMIQTIGHYKMNLKELGIDFASCSAHKFHGPKGAGFVYTKKALGIKAQITGGGQERNMRSGTENTYGIVGLGKAFAMAYEHLEEHKNHILQLKAYAIEQLQNSIPDIAFNGNSGDLNNSLYTILSLALPFEYPMIGFQLELNGIAVSQGSACSSGAAKASNVIQSILPAEKVNQITPLRISFSIYNTKEDIDLLCECLQQLASHKLIRK